MHTIKIMTRDIKRTKGLTSFAMMVVLFVLSAVVNFYMWFLAGAMTGAGHGIYSPIQIVNGPFSVFLLLWAFLITGANAPWSTVQTIARVITCIYYVWLLCNLNYFISRFAFDYRKIEQSEVEPFFWTWVILVVCAHGMIWLPTFVIKQYKVASK